MKIPHFDYYYGQRSEQFAFLRVPRLIITHEQFGTLTLEAKVLYGLMLDRMNLSQKNGWLDEEGRVFIIFPQAEMEKQLNCSGSTVTRIMKQLRNIGFVRSKRQGLNKPDILYVMDFASVESSVEVTPNSSKTSFQNRQIDGTGATKNTKQELSDSQCLIRKNYTENSYTDLSENHINQSSSKLPIAIDMIDKMKTYEQIIKENISYDYLLRQHKYRADEIHELFEIMLETVCSTKDTIRVGREDMPIEVVKVRLLSLDCLHIEYVMDSMDKTTTDVRNIRSYLLTALYRSPTSIVSKYKAEVNHNMYGKTASRQEDIAFLLSIAL